MEVFLRNYFPVSMTANLPNIMGNVNGAKSMFQVGNVWEVATPIT